MFQVARLHFGHSAQSSGSEGKRAFLEHKPLSTIETHTLLAAQIPVNHEAREYFKDKPYAIAVTKRSTEKMKDKPYFLHYSQDSKLPGGYVILPLEYKATKKWSTKSAREEEKNKESVMRQIKGLHPIYEMLTACQEQDLLHPTKEYPGPYGNSTRHLPKDCNKWDCMSLTKFEEPIKYAKFLGA